MIDMKKYLQNYIFIIRIFLVKKLLSTDDKYLIIRAIEDRISNLERIAVSEVWADKDSIYKDVKDYMKLKKCFSSKYWG
jgi:hypothetical protein